MNWKNQQLTLNLTSDVHSESPPIPLSAQFIKKGITYTQLLRGKRSCLYHVDGHADFPYFEVFLIKVRTEIQAWGKIIPPRECYPKDEDFGYWAWFYRDYAQAVARFNDLEKVVVAVTNGKEAQDEDEK